MSGAPARWLTSVLLMTAAALPARASADSLSVLAYNTWLRPVSLFPGEVPRDRASRMPAALGDHDVLILSEVFDAGARDQLLSGLAARGYVHVSQQLGLAGLVVQSGGVLIVSRWPIVSEGQRVFAGLCANTDLCLGGICLVGDCMARKGVVYVAIEKLGRRYHLFGTHLQASDGQLARAVRSGQLRLVRQLIARARIPADQPVLIAGDLNIDVQAQPDFQEMLEVLQAAPPRSAAGLRFSHDPSSNFWARRDETTPKALDHILVSTAHLQPLAGEVVTVAVRFRGLDLSDHHAVQARLEYRAAAAPPALLARRQTPPQSVPPWEHPPRCLGRL